MVRDSGYIYGKSLEHWRGHKIQIPVQRTLHIHDLREADSRSRQLAMIGGGGKFKRSRAISVLTSSLENTVAHSGGGTVAQFQQRQILGKWRQGYALDLHTLSSVPIGYNEYGHMQFDTTRSEVGELLYRLKNRSDTSTVDEIVAAAVTFLNTWHPPIEMIIPVPASSARDVQPVMLLAKGISDQLNIPLVECVTKTRETPQLKNIFDLDERLKALDGVHAVDAAATQGRKILLFDDLYRSGATMNAITSVLYEQGKAADVFALTITRTRSFR